MSSDAAFEPGEDLLALQMQNIRRLLVEDNWDWITLLTGAEGSGKSTLAILSAMKADPFFSGDNVAWDTDGMLQLVENSSPGSAVVFDEAVNGMFAREAMRKENRALAVVGNVARAKNLHWFLCIPNRHNLDHYFRQFRVRLWIHVISRGVANVYVPHRSPFHEEPYWELLYSHIYGPVRGPVWERYTDRKMRYIREKVAEQRERAQS